MNGEVGRRPGLPYLLLGLVIILAGAAQFCYSLFRGLTHLTDDLVQFVVPGQTVIPIAKAGTYTVFLEEQSVIDGKVYSTTESISGLECNVKREGSEAKIGLRRPTGSVSYTVGGRSGRSVLEFNASQTRQYTLSCAYSGERAGPEAVLAVGTGVGGKIASTVLSSLAALFVGGGLGAVFLVMAYRKSKTPRQGMPLG